MLCYFHLTICQNLSVFNKNKKIHLSKHSIVSKLIQYKKVTKVKFISFGPNKIKKSKILIKT